jgi:formylglycine-generating enzyme required for sulfatase activity
MYCLTCNLHFPDHLNFCKHCGRPLARGEAGVEAEGARCTRCGARVVAGENFCQQCGAHTGAKAEDTTIGTCRNCGVLWRSAWLFCKNCGMARANALVTSVIPPPAPSAVPTMVTNVYQPELELSEAAPARPRCPYCAAEVIPNSRFCEACGGKLRTANTGDLNLPAAPEPPPPTQVEARPVAEEGRDARPPARASAHSAPTVIDPSQAEATELLMPAELSAGAGLVSGPPASAPPEEVAAEMERGRRRETVQLDPVGRTGEIISSAESATAGPEAPIRHTLVTPITPPASSPSASVDLSRRRGTRAAWQAAAIRDRSRQAATTPSAQPAAQPSPTLTPAPSPSPTIGPQSPEGMVYVPGGAFQMGRSDGDEFERPVREVTVAPFFIDQTEVTNEQYQEFVRETGHRVPGHWESGQYPQSEGRLPVVNVSWHDANAYARWAGKRLPSEEEWEYAARGSDGRLYPWGPEWKPGLANTDEGNSGRAVEVGRYSAGASPFGALDLCGNVWEWTASSLRSYADGKEVARGRVIRGGAYNVTRDRATATYRGVVQPDKAYDKTGFRCARDAP